MAARIVIMAGGTGGHVFARWRWPANSPTADGR